ncbi:MAG: SMC family ATPase [Erysipelotrichaceae bacterium]|nr:SMC family ATPase [Erysipelotrichaceae bacterium]
MKIKRLRFQAFGPYMQAQDIDFFALNNHHLFLLRGATGAGKTVILDALTYALYGKSSGGDRGEFELMRTKGAKDDLDTYVNVCFIVQGKQYEFERRIQVKHKRNKETYFKTSVMGKEYRNGEYIPFFENCTRSALDRKAEALIGLTHAQFIQVMILPQGKFEQLLVSKSEEKQEILKTLFQSERWGDLCIKLSERLKQEKHELEQLEWQKNALMNQSEGKGIEELEAIQQCDLKQIDVCMQKQKQFQTQIDKQRIVLETQKQLHMQKQRYIKTKNVLEKLLIRHKDIDKQKEELAKQKQLEQLRPYAQSYQDALHQLETQNRNIQAQGELLKQVDIQIRSLLKQETDIAQLQISLEDDKRNCASFEKQMETYDAYVKWKKEQDEWMQQEQVCRKEYQYVLDAMKTMDQKQMQLQAQMETGEQELLSYPQLVEEEQLCQKMEEQKRKERQIEEQIQMQKKQLAASTKQWNELRLEMEQEQKAYEMVMDRYLSNSAAMLSDLLKDGAPCPVCGSLHHPCKAVLHAQAVELKEIHKQKQRAEQLQLDFEQQRLRIEHMQKQIETCTASLSECKEVKSSFPAWDTQYIDTLHQRLESCRQFQKQKEEWMKEKILQKQKKEKLSKQAEQLQKQVDAYASKRLVAQTKCDTLFQHMHIRDASYLHEQHTKLLETIQEKEQKITNWQSRLHDLELQKTSISSAHAHMCKERAEQEVQVEKRKRELERLNRQGWDMDTMLAVSVSTQTLEKSIREHEEQMTQTQAVMQELTSQLDGKQLLDLETLKQDVTELNKQLVTYTQQLYELRLKTKQQADRIRQWRDLTKAMEEKLLVYTRHNAFVKAMRGDNGVGIERYVLSVMLSSITAAANQLLAHVHDGRYRIYRSTKTSGKVRKSGLELCVYDAYSQSERSVISLSGGEKFLVSLALSMALSTVVQAKNGGIRMETMFIDEGFGSLDEQSIADALQLLSNMVRRKSTIGIISHVELLKENIPYGIRVVKDKNGSFCELLV